MRDTYVYTIAAVYARFRRGYIQTKIFIPYIGTVMTVNKHNFPKIRKIFRDAVKHRGM